MEVAGVVLGAWPIVTAGLGRYRKDVKKLKRAAHYDTEVDEWIRSVKFQKIYFHDNMLELLNAVSPGATGILDVADSYREELWSGTVASDCHDYLRPERYALFRELSEGFESCLLELATELDRVQRKPKRKVCHQHNCFTMSTLLTTVAEVVQQLPGSSKSRGSQVARHQELRELWFLYQARPILDQRGRRVSSNQ